MGIGPLGRQLDFGVAVWADEILQWPAASYRNEPARPRLALAGVSRAVAVKAGRLRLGYGSLHSFQYSLRAP